MPDPSKRDLYTIHADLGLFIHTVLIISKHMLQCVVNYSKGVVYLISNLFAKQSFYKWSNVSESIKLTTSHSVF